MKRLFSILLVAAMVLTLSAAAFAAEVDSGKGGAASITITLPTEEIAPTAATTYKIYKVFSATNDGETDAIAYQLVSGKTAPITATDNLSKFDADAGGNVKFYSRTSTDAEWEEDTTTKELSPAMTSAIASYVTDSDLVYTAVVAKGETSVTVTGLEYGYYYITTSTGSLVTVDSTNPTAEVEDKNIIPVVVKSAGTEYDEEALKAINAVGASQSFTAQITKTKGAANLVFIDTMTDMTYNEDVAITVSAGTAPTAAQAKAEKTDDGFKVTFDNAYIAGLADGTVITLVYSGTVTSDALSTDPATNKATLNSGETNTSESETVEVYNAKISVTKKDGDGEPLAGAGFVLSREYTEESDSTPAPTPVTQYYKLVAASGTTPAHIEWVTDIEQATEYTSDADGVVQAFTGLGPGSYKLVEKTVPDGYNKADDKTVNISDSDYTAANLEQSAEITNNAGTELPSTGGIGTTLFYILGTVLVLGAGIVLVARRKVSGR